MAQQSVSPFLELRGGGLTAKEPNMQPQDSGITQWGAISDELTRKGGGYLMGDAF